MKQFKDVSGKCIFCQEEITVQVLTDLETPIETPCCNVLMSVENGKFKRFEGQFNTSDKETFTHIKEVLEKEFNYTLKI